MGVEPISHASAVLGEKSKKDLRLQEWRTLELGIGIMGEVTRIRIHR